MPNQILRRRGNEASHTTFTGGTGEITFVTDNVFLAIHTSSQLGGFIIPKLTADKRTLNNNGIVFANSTTTLNTATTLTWDGTTMTIDGDLTFTGAQTISTSAGILTVTGTGGLTLSTASNTNILINPNGTGDLIVNTTHLVVDTSAARVGIGIAAPTSKLHISASYPQLDVAGTGDTVQTFYTPTGADRYMIGCSIAVASDFGIRNETDTRNDFIIKGDGTIYMAGGGNVGIGTTAPSTLLHVGLAGTTLGTIGIAGNTSGLVTLTVAAAAGTWTMKLPTGVAGTAGFQLTDAGGDGVTSWASAASTKIAKNIINQFQNTKDALNKILSASVYIFKYKEGMGTGDLETEYVGIMAEESPWAMHFNNKILNPVNTFGYTVLSIQALHDKITALEQTIKELTAQKI